MSSLSYICDYGSSSEDSNCQSEEDTLKIVKKAKLPTPDLRGIPGFETDDHTDDPDLHKGRTRSFAHVRGNWASYVFIKYTEEEHISNLITKLLTACPIGDFHVCDNFHISLSKTVTLMYHLIKPFTESLQTAVDGIESFDLGFESVKLFCNLENNRTFISLAVDHISNKYLLKVVDKVDKILADYKLPPFYENPSLHMSVLWTNGNKKAELTDVLEKFNNILYQEIASSLKTVTVQTVNCKIGNKLFQFALR